MEREHRRWLVHGRAFAAGAIATALGVSLSGCPGDADLCDPKNWPGGATDLNYLSYCFPDGGADAGDAGDASADGPIGTGCAGRCLPLAPNGWDAPSLVAMGSELEVPPCPSVAPKLGYEAHAGLDTAALPCGACQCQPPVGSCGLPTALTASSTTCAGTDPGAVHTPFNPPVDWDGGCTDTDGIPPNQACGGGPCVRSLTIGPLSLTEVGCTPEQTPIPKNDSSSWSHFARSCIGASPGSCGDSALGCVPAAPPGFRVCVFHDGDKDCGDPWLAPYTDKHLFYDGLLDTRSCSPCACDPPLGSVCTASISVYPDGACAGPSTNTNLVDSSQSICIDTLAGVGLMSKSASNVTYAPGACQPSGGDPIGTVEPMGPVTFCCLPIP
ncbi:Hypothetical protein A7982_05988 [Minicystis rosea]|nr:Hypothetical protein A7982_05988 [Minicystis rosea]